MSAEVELHQQTELSIVSDQTTFTPAQRTTLAHIGVENANEGDIQVFFHVCKRTGLDPFARQIYMIGRNSKMWDPRTKQEKWVTKFTIQTGIDGYRLIGRRAANAAAATLSVKPVQWAHRDGDWRDVWMSEWGNPVAARITITRSGEEFTATALFDEYKQTTKSGDPTAMWRQRPAGQIAKCAEALAWRMAFPQDLSGLYVEEEMQQADNTPRTVVHQPATTYKDQVRAALGSGPAADPTPEKDEPSKPAAPTAETNPPSTDQITSAQSKKMHATFNDAGITDRAKRLAYASKIVGRELATSSDLTKQEASTVIEALNFDLESDDGIVDATVVEDPAPTPAPPDAATVWQQVLTAAGQLGMDLWQIETDYAESHGGALAEDASGEDLAAYLETLLARSAA